MVNKTPPPAEVKRLWQLGWAIHWLRPKSKIPVDSGWTKGPRADWEQLRARYKPAYNQGVRLGEASKVAGAYLAVLDVDVKSDDPAHAKEAYRELFKLYPMVRHGPHLFSGRGNKSAHFYVRLETPTQGAEVKARSAEVVKVKMPSAVPSKKEAESMTDSEIADGWRLRPAWEISLLCEGRQAAVVGSVHPDTGDTYHWGKAVNGSGADIPLLKAENSAVDAPAAKRAPSRPRGPEPAPRIEFADVRLNDLPLTDAQKLSISEGAGVDDRSAEVFKLCLALVSAGTAEATILSVFTDRANYLGNCAYDHRRTNDRHQAAQWVRKYCLRKAREKIEAGNDVFDVDEIDVPSDGTLKAKQKKSSDGRRRKDPPPKQWPIGFTGSEAWEETIDLKYVGNGKPPVIKSTLANVITILQNKVGADDFLRFEEFAHKTYWHRDTPWGISAGTERSTGIEDAVVIKKWFANTFKTEPPNTMIDEALFILARGASHHVVKEYLEALEWDGVDRIGAAFKTYMNAKMPEPYLSNVSRKFFLACVKRIFEPGCKFDYVVILEGKQGIGKSTFAETLASKPWFMDHLPNVQDKDAALNLQGIWICELGELAAVYRSANEAVKGFISRNTDKIRPPYGHRRIDFPRSTVFLGTTNEEDYFTDATGNRRFWPVRVSQCDFAALIRDRDQLWAEAVHRHFFSPEPLFLADEALHQAVAVQELRRIEDEGDAMRGILSKWLAEEKAKGGKLEINISELFRGPLIFLAANRTNTMRAGNVLRELGLRKIKRKWGNIWA